MARLLELSMDSLSQQETLGFVGKVKDILSKVYNEESSIIVKNFFEAVGQYLDVQQMNSEKASKEKVSDWDHYADDEWRSLNFQIKAGLLQNHDEDQKAAAEIVNKTFSQYKDPTEMKYTKEYEVLEKLLGELEKIPLNIQKAAKVDANIIGLRRRVDDFRTIYTHQINPAEEEEMGLTKSIRVKLNNAWGYLNSFIELDLIEHRNDANREEVVQKLNAAIRAVKPS